MSAVFSERRRLLLAAWSNSQHLVEAVQNLILRLPPLGPGAVRPPWRVCSPIQTGEVLKAGGRGG